MPITVLQFDFYGLILKKYNLVPRAHVSLDQYEDKELWNNRFLVQGFRTFITAHALALTKRHVGSVSEIVRNTHEHLNQLKCYLSF